MNTQPSTMLPIFRSETQARILAWLFLNPDREQAISTLSAVGRSVQPTTLREVNRLLQGGLLKERRAGNTRLVSANTESPYYEPLVQILGRAYGPASVVPEELTGVPGVEQAIIVGSWAERFLGAAGPAPRDVDVIVVGDPDRRSLRRANARLEERLALPVQITVVNQAEWKRADSGFVKTIQERAHLVVLPADSSV